MADTATLALPIEGMSCVSCARRLETALSGAEGVTEATVNFATATAHVSFAPEVTTRHPNSAKLRRLRKAILLFVTRMRPSPRASTSRSTRASRSFDSVLSEKNSSGVTKYPSPANLPTECS